MTSPFSVIVIAAVTGLAAAASVVAAVQGRSAGIAHDVSVRTGEPLAVALVRAGADPREAMEAERLAADPLSDAARLRLTLVRDGPGAPRITALAILDASGEVDLTRGFDGRLRRQTKDTAVRAVTSVSQGTMTTSLLESAEQAGTDPATMEQVGRIFAQRLDVARDIQPGDPFVIVFDREATAGGATVATGALRYAEVDTADGPQRFYAFERGGDVTFFDADGRSARGFLLRTPLDGARVTSAFGLRLHPILGFTRMHQGIDFGAPTGTPVFAAGDGVVEAAALDGGYGQHIRLRHDAVWETAYAHLSAISPEVRPGARVRQGQLIGFVGATGLATGPHLHFEIWRGGVAIDPAGAESPRGGAALTGSDLAAFQAERARIDAVRLAATHVSAPQMMLKAAL